MCALGNTFINKALTGQAAGTLDGWPQPGQAPGHAARKQPTRRKLVRHSLSQPDDPIQLEPDKRPESLVSLLQGLRLLEGLNRYPVAGLNHRPGIDKARGRSARANFSLPHCVAPKKILGRPTNTSNALRTRKLAHYSVRAEPQYALMVIEPSKAGS